MLDATALKVAIQLHHMPANVRMVRDNPLPSGIPLLLQVAAEDPDALREAGVLTERPAQELRQAARFFIEQILWHPGADSFRILGATPTTSASDLKRNMSSLMSWLHPDVEHGDARSIFAVRVTNAWNDVKTTERRQQYAASLAHKVEHESAKKQRHARREAIRRQKFMSAAPQGFLRRFLARLFKV
jgi:hypothetical protein